MLNHDTWTRTTDASGGNCVEAKLDGDKVIVRNSQDPHGPQVAYTRSEWQHHLDGVRNTTMMDLPA